MTEYAILGEAHTTIPEGIEEWDVDFQFQVFPWRCPTCDQVLAQTIVQRRRPQVRTLLTFSPVHDASADIEGVPFYGPTRRAMRERQERRRIIRLASETFTRARVASRMGENVHATDHVPVEAMEFDTICDNCPRRLRIVVPTPWQTGM